MKKYNTYKVNKIYNRLNRMTKSEINKICHKMKCLKQDNDTKEHIIHKLLKPLLQNTTYPFVDLISNIGPAQQLLLKNIPIDDLERLYIAMGSRNDALKKIIKDGYIKRKQQFKQGNEELRTKVNEYFKDKQKAEEKYGKISTWDTKWVDDMSDLFKNKLTFNEDINTKVVSLDDGTTYTAWDVSNVRNMKNMFYGAKQFNRDLSSWDVSNVRNMKNMFLNAHAFNGDLSSWNVGNVRDMQKMFSHAHAFNGEISNWDFKNLKDARYMLQDVNVFSGSVRDRPIEITELMGNIIQKIKDDRDNAGKPAADIRAIIPNYDINVLNRPIRIHDRFRRYDDDY